jgi:hypothetical protein
MLQPYFKSKMTQQTSLYLHIMEEVHGSSSVTAQAVQKLFTKSRNQDTPIKHSFPK